VTRPFAVWSVALLASASTGWTAAFAQESRPDAVATIDGHSVTRSELVRHVIEEHWAAVGDELVAQAVLDLEARLPAPETSPAETRPLRSKLEAYDVAKLGDDPPPPAGFVVEVREKEGPESRQVTEAEAVAYVAGRTPGALRAAAADLVDSLLVDRELARAGKEVTAAEVAAWQAAMQKKHPPPFDWRQKCKFMKTTPEREGLRWRRVEAWKRVTGWKLDEKELRRFFEANKARLSGTHAPGSKSAKDLDEPLFRDLVVSEFETEQMKVWLTALRAKAKVWIAPDSELAKIR
jgi:hypothetical protein